MNNSTNELKISEQEPKEHTVKLLTDYTDTVARKTLYTTDSQAKTLLTKRMEDRSSEHKQETENPLKDRLNEDFDPYSRDSAHKAKKSLFRKWFGKMESTSLRKASIGLVSGILGTGILAIPQGMAEYGWQAGLAVLAFSAICQIFSFYLLNLTQALTAKSDSYTGMVEKIVGPKTAYFVLVMIFVDLLGSFIIYALAINDFFFEVFGPMLAYLGLNDRMITISGPWRIPFSFI